MKRDTVAILILLLAIALPSLPIEAQTDSVAVKLQSLAAKAYAFNEMCPQEKVYLAFDNTGYYVGDTVWFKANVLHASTLQATSLSRVLYVDLVAPEGYLVKRAKYKVEDGACNGQIFLDDSLGAGYYEVRAYTRYMLNFGVINHSDKLGKMISMTNKSWNDSMWNELVQLLSDKNMYFNDEFELWAGEEYTTPFSRVFPVYDKPLNKGEYVEMIHHRSILNRRPKKETEKNLEKKRELDLKFYPEGGTAVAGIPCCIAFEALRLGGEPTDISGYLIDAKGDSISCIATDYRGRGCFEYDGGAIPVTAVVQFEGEDYKFDLPRFSNEGYVLHVDALSCDTAVLLTVATSQNFDGKLLGVSLLCRGRLCYYKEIRSEGSSGTLFSVPLEHLATGVNQAILFDADGNTLAERFFFVDLHDRDAARLHISYNTDTLSALEPLTVECRLSDAAGNPLQGERLSLAVRDRDSEVATYNTGNIYTELLLASDLKGYIEAPGYYFEKDDSLHSSHLDQLLLVQGWRRYDWATMSGSVPFSPRYGIEKKLTAGGWVYKGWNITSPGDTWHSTKPVKDKEVSIAVYSDTLGDAKIVQSDTAGRFRIFLDDEYGEGFLFVKAVDKREKELFYDYNDEEVNLYYIPLEQIYFGVPRQYSFFETNPPADNLKLLLGDLSSVELPDSGQYAFGLQKLNEVVVKKGWKNIFRKIDYSRPAMVLDAHDEANRLYDMGLIGVHHVFRNLTIFRLRMYGVINFTWKNWFMEQPEDTVPSLNLPPVSIGFSKDIPRKQYGLAMPFEKVDRILIYNDMDFRRRYRGDYQTHSDVVFHVYTFRDGKTTIPTYVGRRVRFQLFTRPADFYSPDYAGRGLPEGEKDVRRTLYWNPNVVTDSAGCTVLHLYNSSVCRYLSVSGEGITSDGCPFSFKTTK